MLENKLLLFVCWMYVTMLVRSGQLNPIKKRKNDNYDGNCDDDNYMIIDEVKINQTKKSKIK